MLRLQYDQSYDRVLRVDLLSDKNDKLEFLEAMLMIHCVRGGAGGRRIEILHDGDMDVIVQLRFFHCPSNPGSVGHFVGRLRRTQRTKANSYTPLTQYCT
jgi:hypothetical protein